ncbi:MAG: spermidine synthase [Pseudolabrys sp.]
MASLETTASSPARYVLPAALMRFAPAVFAAALFVSALLLFAVQPMFTKMVLPRLGGSPSVWSVAMVSFQAFLFVGYLYAHLVSRVLAPAHAALLHLGLLALVATVLPLGIADGFAVPPADGVTLWLIGLFAASIGLPFVALSASAPLLQNWFVATGHPRVSNPYVLYAASNLGSFCALIGYPLVIEPLLTLGQQTFVWSVGFAGLVACVAVAGCLAARGAIAAARERSGSGPAVSQRLSWIALTAIPVGLTIAVTSYITTDLAATPFLWVIPLALYLLTFVAVFRERPWISHALVLRLVPYAIAPAAVSILSDAKTFWLATMLLNLLVFVLIALACHGEAYRRRPDTGWLTEFYLWISFGGLFGGIFAGLVAPFVFNNIYEYPILIGAALLVLPGMFAGGIGPFARQAGPFLLAAAVAVAARPFIDMQWSFDVQTPMRVFLVALAAAMLFSARQPRRFFGLIVFTFVVTGLFGVNLGMTRVETVRSFFGVHQVVETADGRHRLLLHGTTSHGAERVRDAAGQPVAGRPDPLTYYYFGGPLSDAVEAARGARGRLDRVAVVGLGTGSLACHQRSGERWTFFEIDAAVARIARDASKFRFLSACAPDVPVVLGDARLTLASSQVQYDLIVLDAFSSDAIPIHLLTREAFAGYRARLAPRGVIAAHISNQHMELASVVAAVGAAEGLVAWFKRDAQANDFRKDYRANSEVVVLAREPSDLGDLRERAGWRRIESSVAPWSDDYSNVLAAILRRKIGR